MYNAWDDMKVKTQTQAARRGCGARGEKQTISNMWAIAQRLKATGRNVGHQFNHVLNLGPSLVRVSVDAEGL